MAQLDAFDTMPMIDEPPFLGGQKGTSLTLQSQRKVPCSMEWANDP